MTCTGDRFLADQVDHIEIDGQTVHSAVVFELTEVTKITAKRVAHNGQRPEGLVLESSTPIEVAGVKAKRIALWSDTAPEVVELTASAGRLMIWNVWRDDEIEHAWVGWAGIRRTDHEDTPGEDRITLHCSDGHPPSGPVGIEVDLTFEPQPVDQPTGEDL